MVDGTSVAFSQHVSRGGELAEVDVVEAYKVNPGLDPKLFSAP